MRVNKIDKPTSEILLRWYGVERFLYARQYGGRTKRRPIIIKGNGGVSPEENDYGKTRKETNRKEEILKMWRYLIRYKTQQFGVDINRLIISPESGYYKWSLYRYISLQVRAFVYTKRIVCTKCKRFGR